MRPPFPIETLADAQRTADRAAYARSADAAALRERASRLRGLDAMHNWTYRNLLCTEAEVDEMAARMSIGYGIPVGDLKDAAMRLLTDAARNG
jgi:hypothetical protein